MIAPADRDVMLPPPRTRVRVAAAIVIGVLCLVVGEVGARIVHVTPQSRNAQAASNSWTQSDPMLGWRARGGGVYRANNGTETTILPDGSRTVGPGPSAGPSVLLVGCSFTFGVGLRDDETLGWKLQQRFPDVRFRNFGASGYGTYQSLLLLRDLVETKHEHPALVIYGFVPFHADRNVLTATTMEGFRFTRGGLFSPPRVAVRDGRLLTFPPYVVKPWPLEDRSGLVSLLHKVEVHVRFAGRERGREQATTLLLSEMKALTDRIGARLLVATLWDGDSRWRSSYQTMRAGMRAAGIEELDVTYRGPETRPEKLEVVGDGHPSGLVDTWWADTLEPWIRRQDLRR